MATQAPVETLLSGRPLIRDRRRIEWDRRPLTADVPPGKLRIATRVTAISPGTELRLYRGDVMSQQVWQAFSELDRSTRGRESSGRPEPSPDNAGGTARYPVGIGYNNVGSVLASGDGAGGIAPGTRVFTIARHEQFYDIEPWEAVPLPDGVDDDDAVFAYLATLGLHALRRGRWQPGEPLVVLGLGVVGLAAALTANAFGAPLLAVDAFPARLRLARQLLPGAEVMDPGQAAALGSSVAETVIDAAGGVPALELGIALARPKARVVLLALHPENVGAIFGGLFYEKELSLVGTGNDPYYVPEGSDGPSIGRNIACILDLIARKRVSYRGLITARNNATDAARAFSDLDGQRDGAIVGSVLDWAPQ
jgi:threonine dehydrogenase-like Zn-dependent dehydrogenase